ncbi:MAG TPA: prepilin-type N-terminal cleavage/methylation domain-containing protein, partial [Elusimicrobiota bacterium]|nr:prepilin-type N-terminal cleavage/methylation domain-containing protein [Elusimicrobiota bacterium]
MGLKRFTSKAFTLIELMLVVAIIGLLSAIALPKFANLVIKAKEAALKGKLGALRSAISIYYANNEGVWPYDLNHFSGTITPLVPRYVDEVPSIQIPTVPSH